MKKNQRNKVGTFHIAFRRIATLLFFAKPISEWFGKDGDTDKKIIETTNEA